MLRLRDTLARIYRRLAASPENGEGRRNLATVRMAQVTSAIHFRELSGQETTLRQLHKISELSQPEALSVVAELERAGIVMIERNDSDAFESKITLSQDASERLERVVDREAA